MLKTVFHIDQSLPIKKQEHFQLPSVDTRQCHNTHTAVVRSIQCITSGIWERMSSEPIKMLSRWVHVRCTSNQMEMTVSTTDSLFCHEDTSSRKWATYLDDMRFCSCTWLSSSISISSSSMHSSGTCVRWCSSY